jgi:hypothetical protein
LRIEQRDDGQGWSLGLGRFASTTLAVGFGERLRGGRRYRGAVAEAELDRRREMLVMSALFACVGVP